MPLLNRQAVVRQGAYLPHWTTEDAIYHVVFRLADSLPANVVARFRFEQEILLNSAAWDHLSTAEIDSRLRNLFSDRIESVLDRGSGVCWLARDEIAALTSQALRHFDGLRYALHAWCIMPNHVHVIVQPADGHTLPAILKSWKGFIAHEANRLLSRAGQFWQPEYYDHLIRSEVGLAQTIRYLQANPTGARLVNWPWVWPSP